MKTLKRTVLIFVLAATTVLCTPQPQNVQPSPSPRCELIERALRDYDQIKIGDRRKDVERRFRQGGGTQFPGTTRYAYVDSQFLHIDIEYQIDPSAKISFSPDDVITKKSKLYIDYEPKD
jgi:hypothetical protein